MSVRQLLSAKIHGGTVTRCDLYYEGSCGLGPDLLEASGLLPFLVTLPHDRQNRHTAQVHP